MNNPDVDTVLFKEGQIILCTPTLTPLYDVRFTVICLLSPLTRSPRKHKLIRHLSHNLDLFDRQRNRLASPPAHGVSEG